MTFQKPVLEVGKVEYNFQISPYSLGLNEVVKMVLVKEIQIWYVIKSLTRRFLISYEKKHKETSLQIRIKSIIWYNTEC